MRNLLKYPITNEEVVKFVETSVELEAIIASVTPPEHLPIGGMDALLAKTTLAVIKAASTIVQSDIGSPAAELLGKAFDSQNIH